MVVPRWVQLVLLPLALLALWALAKAAGKVLLIFVVAAVIALILNPARRLPPALAAAPRAGGAGRVPRILPDAGRDRLPAGQPDLQSGRTFTAQPAAHRQRSQQADREPAERTEPTRHPRRTSSSRARRRCRRSRRKSSKSASRSASFGGGLLTEVRRAPASTSCSCSCCPCTCSSTAQRIGALVRRAMPDGDGTPADDYPHAGPARGLALRRRPAAVQRRDGHLRRPRAVRVRGARHLPRRRASTRSPSACSTA